MSDNATVQVIRDAAVAARGFLRQALAGLQTLAWDARGTPLEQEAIRLAEGVADASSTLFSLEEIGRDLPAALERLAQAQALVRGVLVQLQTRSAGSGACESFVEPLAQALSTLFEALSFVSPAGGVRHRLETAPTEPRTIESDSGRGAEPIELAGTEPASEARTHAVPDGASPASPRRARLNSEIPLVRQRRKAGQPIVLEVEVGYETESNFYADMTMDVATGGVFVATHRAFPLGTAIRLSLALPDGHVIQSAGEVRWKRESSASCGPGLGVAFVDLGAEHLAAIRRFCRRRPPTFFDK